MVAFYLKKVILIPKFNAKAKSARKGREISH